MIVAIIAVVIGGYLIVSSNLNSLANQSVAAQPTNPNSAMYALGKLAVKAAATHDGYSREQFGSGWAPVGNCDMREFVLSRDMQNVKMAADNCTVTSATLEDPYTGKTIQFARGPGTSSAVQIDHIVAVSNAWQTGAQELSPEVREQLYNDPLELLAVDGKANDDKGASDASGWLPPNKTYDCRYVARQIAVKQKYQLWVTPSEHTAMQRTLNVCPDQLLPTIH